MTRYGGTNAKRHRMLCRSCNHSYRRKYDAGIPVGERGTFGRYTLRRHPDKYKQQRRINCPHCGSSDVRSVEAVRRREKLKANLCDKLGLFPHVKGTLLGCECHPKRPDDWTPEEQRQVEGMLATSRSG